jgi:hypothetical protein
MKLEYSKDTYKYFSTLNPDITQGKILDYGSNWGTFLASADDKILHKNYLGVDVDKDSLVAGRNSFPDATFIDSEYYNCMYNSSGSLIRPKTELFGPYKTVISYSVLTHTTVDDFWSTVEWLYLQLEVGGKLMITWLDVDDLVTRTYFYTKRIKEFGTCDTIKTDSYLYLADNLKVDNCPESVKYFLLFFKRSYLEQELRKRYNKISLHSSLGTKNCFQSCLVIERDSQNYLG